MHCSACGVAAADSAKFCHKCGAALEQGGATPAPSPQSAAAQPARSGAPLIGRGVKIFAAVALGGLALLAFVGIVIDLSQTNSQSPASTTASLTTTSTADSTSAANSDRADEFVSNIQQGISYDYFGGGSTCNADSSNVCMTKSQYKAVCEAATGVATGALTSYEMTTGDGISQALANNGDWSVQGISWDSSQGTCDVNVSLSGDIYGTTQNREVEVTAGSFEKNPKGQLWVASF